MTEKDFYELENVRNGNKEEYWMFYEKNREKSFQNWPFDETAACNPMTLSEAGFYHIPTDNEPDAVRCFCCFKELDGWEPEDDPWQEHVKHSPKCHFLSLRKPLTQMTMEELVRLECDRVVNKVGKITNAKIAEFQAQAAKVRDEMKKLGK